MKDDWQGRLPKFIFLTPMEWDKKIPLGRQDLRDKQDFFALRRDTLRPRPFYPDDPAEIGSEV
jgi:hypothetical protein